MVNLQATHAVSPKITSDKVFSPNAFQEGIKRPAGTSSAISGQKVQPVTKM
jgi:hypothetical protein